MGGARFRIAEVGLAAFGLVLLFAFQMARPWLHGLQTAATPPPTNQASPVSASPITAAPVGQTPAPATPTALPRSVPNSAGIVPVPTARPRLTPTPSPVPTAPLARLEPRAGTYVGVSVDWAKDSSAAFNQRFGRNAAVYVTFFHFPFTSDDLRHVESFINQVASQRGAALITLEPRDGLDMVTPTVADEFADRLARYNRRGIPVFVRFAHEMNGSWYPWSQQPGPYIRAFRVVAEAVHRKAPLSAMMWAPNYGAGYPFTGGQFEAKPGAPEFELLDTDRDGRLTTADDMYAPYYPGDDVVDWVGMSLYHWGNHHPWLENELPEPDKFVQHLTGSYNGLNGDESMVPDFYHIYAERHGKPLSITETAAFYNPSRSDSVSEIELKRAWWRQVFNERVMREYPRIKMVNWFEWRKFEVEVNDTIDWTISSNPELLKLFFSDLPSDRLLFANDVVFHWPVSPGAARPPSRQP